MQFNPQTCVALQNILGNATNINTTDLANSTISALDNIINAVNSLIPQYCTQDPTLAPPSPELIGYKIGLGLFAAIFCAFGVGFASYKCWTKCKPECCTRRSGGNEDESHKNDFRIDLEDAADNKEGSRRDGKRSREKRRKERKDSVSNKNSSSNSSSDGDTKKSYRKQKEKARSKRVVIVNPQVQVE